MKIFCLIKKNTYFDSVTLMGITKRLASLEGIMNLSVSMGSDLNKALLLDSGMSTPEAEAATPNDLIISFSLEDEENAVNVFESIEKGLVKRSNSNSNKTKPVGIKSALNISPDANMVVISLPGEYAVSEAKRALQNDLHVMMFSDNISIEDELKLKSFAHDKGLLMMGPDCGTAIINQKALCFANAVNQGHIGVIGASGTGTQELTVLLDQYGYGISQVIGTGGRDLSKSINAIMMCDALQALAQDPETDLIVLVSKPPEDSVADKVTSLARQVGKPVVICFLSEGTSLASDANLHFANTLEEGAQKAVMLLDAYAKVTPVKVDQPLVAEKINLLNPTQKYIRGVFCGGTLTEEARIIFKNQCPGLSCYSNVAKKQEEKLTNPNKSVENSFVDMGDDTFTVGKPHPMIDPTLRNLRLIQEASDPQTAVILLDVVLGFGSNEDPAGVTLEGIESARQVARKQGREIIIVCYVLGTDKDPQSMALQKQKLESAGVLLGESNAHAARIAAEIIRGIQ